MIALLVCLIPTTIGALLAAIGIAGMDRALRANILAKSGKAVETAGDIDVVLLDKTGTITMGNRHATEFLPIGRYSASDVARLASLASAADETPEGKSIKTKAKELVTIGQLPLKRSGWRRVRPVHCANAHEWYRPPKRPKDSQRCFGRHRKADRGPKRHVFPRSLIRWLKVSLPKVRHHSWSPKTRKSLGSSSWKTS